MEPLPIRALAWVAIVILCVAAAVSYGIVHDQITVRVSLEYFTIGHPTLLETASPTRLALFWGVTATWWWGLVGGVPVAFAATLGSRSPCSPSSLVKPIARLLGWMGLSALLAGCLGFGLAHVGFIELTEPLSTRVPEDEHPSFLAVGWSHAASYVVGFAGALALAVSTWVGRRRP